MPKQKYGAFASARCPHLWESTMRKASILAAPVIAACIAGAATIPASAAPRAKTFSFNLVAAQTTCLQHASGQATIQSLGPVETLHVDVFGLPPNTDFDFFVIQVPKAPFGLSWYQGDIETDGAGHGVGNFIGRFSIETFIVAPGVAPAPVVFPTDANTNPKTNPVQIYHLGLWFNSPKDALKAGCPGTVTPFNGEHNAGVQVLNTSNFPDLNGPLRQIH